MKSEAKQQTKANRAARKVRLKTVRVVQVPGPDGLRDDFVCPSGKLLRDVLPEAVALLRKGGRS